MIVRGDRFLPSLFRVPNERPVFDGFYDVGGVPLVEPGLFVVVVEAFRFGYLSASRIRVKGVA